MNISIHKNNENSATINVEDTTFFVYDCTRKVDTNESYHSNESETYCDYHIHAGFEIQYVIKGSVLLQTEHGNYLANEGSIIIIPPYNYHQIDRSFGGFKRSCFSFSIFLNNYNIDESENFSASKYLFYNRILSKIDGITIFKSLKISHTMGRIVEEYEKAENDCTIMALMNLFLNDMFEELKVIFKENEHLNKEKSNAKKFNYFNEKQKYIIENCLANYFKEDYPAEIIERALNTSKRNAARIVYNLFNENISDLVLKYRMKVARLYLENTDISFGEIANKVGYKTYAAFFTAFKKYYGISPKEYKENY